jgi:predicted N-acetyltransferase YhbS
MPTSISTDLTSDTSHQTRLRPIVAADLDAAARITFDAFAGIADRHAFPRDFPTLDSASQLVAAFAEHPQIHGVVAERDGRVIGSNFLDERSAVRGVGPIAVAPNEQDAGLGRLLMRSVLDRCEGRSVRLLQDSFNTASLALYASLGFGVVEQVAVVAGVPCDGEPSAVDVRPLDKSDVGNCERLCLAVHGYERTTELRDALGDPGLTPVGAWRGGRLVAYATTLSDFGMAYAVAYTEADLFGLIAGAGAAGPSPVSLLVPLYQHELIRRCLAAGLRIVKPMTYMAVGPYQRPRGAWIPSVLA